jgi:hopanoid biosynthesis associated RND transporter like protein HpnN
MTAEGKPSEKRSYLLRPLQWITQSAIRFPLATVILSVGLAVVSSVYAALFLEVRTNRLDLLNPQSQFNRRWLRFIHEFGEKDDVVVVVEGRDMAAVVKAIDAAASRIRSESQLFEQVLERVDAAGLKKKGLYFLPQKQLQQIDRRLEALAPILAGDWSLLALGTALAAETIPKSDGQEADPAFDAVAARERFHQSLVELLAAVEGSRPEPHLWSAPPAASEPAGPEYLMDQGGRFAFVLLKLVGEAGGGGSDTEAIARLRELISTLSAAHPAVKIGLTGLPVMEHDELLASRVATNRAGALSLLGVAVLFVTGLGGVRHPVLALGVLIVGIAWSVGFAELAVGHLNLLSMAFGVILVGLGIDFSIHYLACYQELRREMPSAASATLATVTQVGEGIVTGGLTTGVAFFCAGLSDFTGLAELGIIAGGGVLLCMMASLVVLPAALVVFDPPREQAPSLPPLATARWFGPLHETQRVTLASSLAATLLLMAGAFHLYYDHNLLNLQPPGLESVELERRLLAESNQSLWYALSIAERRDEIDFRKEQFLRLPSVERVEEIASLIPIDAESKRPLIERISRRLIQLPDQTPQIPVLPPLSLRQALETWRAGFAAVPGGGNLSQEPFTADLMERIEAHLEVLSEAEYYQRVADYQAAAVSLLLRELKWLRESADPQPPSFRDLPGPLVSRFVGRSGIHLLKVYGRGEIWDMASLERFVTDVRRVDPEATGKPLQTYEASRQMLWNYMESAAYALCAVLLIVWIDFRSLRLTLLAMMPVLAGIAQMFGILGWLGIPLNAANMIVLPLILGIGIDDGVHVVHDFRRQGDRYRLSSSTATAILMTSLTSMVGFGSLMGASHRGLESLGRVLTIGISCCLLTSLATLPALLGAIGRRSLLGMETRGGSGRMAAEDEGEPRGRPGRPHTSTVKPNSDRLSRPAARW